MVAEVTVFSHEFSFCPELSNLRIVLFSHGASRRVTVLLSRDLSFGPTDQREVICELSNWFIFTRRIAESHGVLSRDLSFGPTDQREVICELSIFSSHGMSRMVTGFCHELSNYRISFHTEDHGGFLCHTTCSWSRICELSNFFLHTDGRGGYEGGTIEA